jgi:hypothetical protein
MCGTSDAMRKSAAGMGSKWATTTSGRTNLKGPKKKEEKGHADKEDNKARETRGLTDTTNKFGPQIGLAVQAAQAAREAREPRDQVRRAGST